MASPLISRLHPIAAVVQCTGPSRWVDAEALAPNRPQQCQQPSPLLAVSRACSRLAQACYLPPMFALPPSWGGQRRFLIFQPPPMSRHRRMSCHAPGALCSKPAPDMRRRTNWRKCRDDDKPHSFKLVLTFAPVCGTSKRCPAISSAKRMARLCSADVLIWRASRNYWPKSAP